MLPSQIANTQKWIASSTRQVAYAATWIEPPDGEHQPHVAYLGLAHKVQQRGLAVVNVAHHGDHGRARHQEF